MSSLDSVTIDEADVPAYRLPDPLVLADGRPVDAERWPERRSEILRLFEDHVFGRTPTQTTPVTATVTEQGRSPHGAATRMQARLHVLPDLGIDVLLHVPADAPVGATFVVPNFEGNHTTTHDPAVHESRNARRDRGDDVGPRGSKAHRFPLEEIVGRGHALATFYAGDVDADVDDGHAHGPHRHVLGPDRTHTGPHDWGTIGAWAWGCSRVLDWLEEVDGIDARRVLVGGHSRLGKTALWAAAQDQRFAGAFSNNSGCTGAALSRRRFGENVAVINDLFPHWFCRDYRRFAGAEDTLPVDQHQLLALIAPRPLLVGSAADDLWADPTGERLATEAAGPVYGLLGAGARIGHHERPGGHELTAEDWAHYLRLPDLVDA